MPKSNTKLIGIVLGILFLAFSGNLSSKQIGINPEHPERYTVVKGDTLWDIAGRFLREPWRWPDVWQANPQIANPHLIYPGDVIVLSYVDGAPRLRLERGRRGPGGTIRLSPRIRSEPISDAIPTIPLDAVHQFLSRPSVVDRGELSSAPYIVKFGGQHIVGGAEVTVYARAIQETDILKYQVVRPGRAYRDPDTGEVLGYEALFVGDADLKKTGDPATLTLVSGEREAIIGDRVIPYSEAPVESFQPKPPPAPVRGAIISVMDGISQIGQYDVVVLSRGSDDGLEPGHVLAIDQRGRNVRDIVAGRGERVRLPDEEAGTLMVFRTFPRVSFGLVMEATRPLHMYDIVRNP